MTFRIAVVQPISHRPGEDEANVADAVQHIERAAADRANFVCFPESYPGPWRMPAAYDPTAVLAEAARRHGVHVVFGTIEPIDAKAATAYNLTCDTFYPKPLREAAE
jgi:predicted amidohydrolase